MRAEQPLHPTYYCRLPSWLGELLLISDGRALTGLYFEGQKDYPTIAPHWRRDEGAEPFAHARAQWRQYETGERRDFDLELAPRGTAFQIRVWEALRTIGCGQTISYRDLAARAGCARAIRAVGTAVGRNPLSVVIPCHRVIASDGSLAGYAGGLDRKRALLAHEGVAQAAGTSRSSSGAYCCEPKMSGSPALPLGRGR